MRARTGEIVLPKASTNDLFCITTNHQETMTEGQKTIFSHITFCSVMLIATMGICTFALAICMFEGQQQIKDKLERVEQNQSDSGA